MKLAISYRRFSTPAQASGDSFRRQQELAERWCLHNGYVLDHSLTYADPGVSAFKGRNRESGALADFLEQVRKGYIPSGTRNEDGESETVLLIENLDRLSREYARKALRTLEEIVEAGVAVVTLFDGKRYTEKGLNEDPIMLLGALLSMVRANEESATKGKRVAQAKAEKRKKIIAGSGERFTRICPGWLVPKDSGTGFQVIEERAEIIREIYRRYLAGDGFGKILGWLHREGIKPFGKGERWGQTSLKRIISSPRVCGVVQFSDGTESHNYYPAIISTEDWLDAQSIRAAKAGGRKLMTGGTGFALSRLLVCASCGSRVFKQSKGQGYSYLVCENKACGFRIKTEPVVDAIKAALAADAHIPGLAPEFADAVAAAAEQKKKEIAGLQEQSKRLAEAVAEGSKQAKQALLQTEARIEQEQLVLFSILGLLGQIEPKKFADRVTMLRAALAHGDDEKVNRLLTQLVEKIELGNGQAVITWRHSAETSVIPIAYRTRRKKSPGDR